MVMGVSPVLVVCGAIYHWYPKITGRMLNETLGRVHFWGTFLGTYAIYLPMHYLGILGVPRRYFAMGDTYFVPDSVHTMNAGITIAAIFVAAMQLIFLFNLAWSLKHGKQAGSNPWRATTLEWQTPDTPPKHGNWAGVAGRLSVGLRVRRARPEGGLRSAEPAAGRPCIHRARSWNPFVNLVVASAGSWQACSSGGSRSGASPRGHGRRREPTTDGTRPT